MRANNRAPENTMTRKNSFAKRLVLYGVLASMVSQSRSPP